jgi:phosphatidylglycerophosphatase A
MLNKSIIGLATGLGLGYMPLMPGTFGTLLGLPLWWMISSYSATQQSFFIITFTIVAIWIADRAEKIWQTHDAQKIVIDEVAGMLVAGFMLPFKWPQVLTAFVIFRILDMTKPGPIRMLDEKILGGLGVVLDDIAAGIVTCALVHGIFWVSS